MRRRLTAALLAAALAWLPPVAQAQIIGGGVFSASATGGGGGCTGLSGPTICVNYLGQLIDTSAHSTGVAYTFATENFGTPSADRIIVVTLTSGSSTGTSPFFSMTIGGVAGTQALPAGGTGTRYCEIWFAAVPTGSTGDIVVTPINGTAPSTMTLGYYSISNTTQTTYSSRSGATATNVPSGTTAANTLTVPAGGVTISVGRISSYNGATISGDAGLTVTSNYNQVIPGVGIGMVNAYGYGTAASHTITLNNVNTGSMCLGSIAWG